MISRSMQAEALLESLLWQTQSEVMVRHRVYRSHNGITNMCLSKSFSSQMDHNRISLRTQFSLALAYKNSINRY